MRRPAVLMARMLLMPLVLAASCRAQPAANLTRRSTDGLLIPAAHLQIVLIGSSDSERREFIDAADKTVARLFKTIFYTGGAAFGVLA